MGTWSKNNAAQIEAVNANVLVVDARVQVVDARVQVVDALHDVPAKDSAENLSIRDAVGNKNDSHSSGSLHGKTKEMIEHMHSSTVAFPDLADGVTVSTAGGGWAGGYGPLVEIIPADALSKDFDIHFFGISNITANGEYQCALYSGAPGAEAKTSCFRISRSSVQSQEGSRLTLTPLFLAGTRISVAIAGSPAAIQSVKLTVEAHEY